MIISSFSFHFRSSYMIYYFHISLTRKIKVQVNKNKHSLHGLQSAWSGFQHDQLDMGCAKGSCSHICQNWNSALVLKMSQRTLSIATGSQIGETHLKRSVDYDIKVLTSLTIKRIMGTGQCARHHFRYNYHGYKRMIGRKSQHVVSASFSLRKGWFWREVVKNIWTMFYKFLISGTG